MVRNIAWEERYSHAYAEHSCWLDFTSFLASIAPTKTGGIPACTTSVFCHSLISSFTVCLKARAIHWFLPDICYWPRIRNTPANVLQLLMWDGRRSR